MDTLSIQAPNLVCVPCIAMEAGPKKVEADAYKSAILKDPKMGVLPLVASFESLKNIYKPAITKPKLPKVFAGSLKKPPLTRSHHLEISPMACSFAAGVPQPSYPNVINKIAVSINV